MLGIASAPASTITSEQTAARIGRRMNVSTNMWRSTRLHGGAVADLLYVGDDHPIARDEAAPDDVVVAGDGPDSYRLLTRDEPLLRGLGDEDEVLSGDAVDGHDRHRQPGIVVPDDPCTDVLHHAQARRHPPQRRLHEH